MNNWLLVINIRPRLFKDWIVLSTGKISIQRIVQLAFSIFSSLIHWIAIYPVDTFEQPGPDAFHTHGYQQLHADYYKYYIKLYIKYYKNKPSLSAIHVLLTVHVICTEGETCFSPSCLALCAWALPSIPCTLCYIN